MAGSVLRSVRLCRGCPLVHRPRAATIATMPYLIRITTADGRQLLWHKAGRHHQLPDELGPMWVANFKPALFQVLPDGSIVPRGATGAADIATVALEPAPPAG
jgi:hypothetical protein